MERDMEVVRKILRLLQLGDTLRFWSPMDISRALGESSNKGRQRTTRDHLELLRDEGFVTEVIGGVEDCTFRITWKGYDLLGTLPHPRNAKAEAMAMKGNLSLKRQP